MKSGTSFFNSSVLRKDLTRFMPVWIIYTLGCLLVLHSFVSQTDPQYAAKALENMLSVMVFANFCYAFVVAVVLFGDLFQPRLCNALHAMPLRREGWFLTHLTSGFCFSFGPYLLVAISFLPRVQLYGHFAFLWLLGAQLQFIFFFALAVFCVFCTGNRIGAGIFYGLINFLSPLAAWFIQVIYQPMFFGVTISTDWYARLCPVIYMMDWYDWNNLLDPSAGPSHCWICLMILTGISPLLLGASLLLYRRRKLECAGDFLAFKPLRPVFLLVYTLSMGMIFQAFSSVFSGSSGVNMFLAVGILIGWFTGLMLLDRSIRVFRFRHIAGVAALSAFLLLTIGLTWLDPLGYTRIVPEPESISMVYADSDGYSIKITDPEDVDTIVEIHKSILSDRDLLSPYNDTYNSDALSLHYALSDGSSLSRSYSLPADSVHTQTLLPLFSKPEYILGCEDRDSYRDSLYHICVDGQESWIFSGDEARELLDAVWLDAQEGSMAQSWVFHDRFNDQYAAFGLEILTRTGTNYITVWSDAEHTMQWLDDHNVGWD